MLRKKTTLTKRLNEGLKAADEVTRVREQQPARRESETMNVVITRSDVLREMQQFHQQYLSRINTIVGMALDDTRALGGVGLTDDALAGGGHGTSGEGIRHLAAPNGLRVRWRAGFDGGAVSPTENTHSGLSNGLSEKFTAELATFHWLVRGEVHCLRFNDLFEKFTA